MDGWAVLRRDTAEGAVVAAFQIADVVGIVLPRRTAGVPDTGCVLLLRGGHRVLVPDQSVDQVFQQLAGPPPATSVEPEGA